MQLAGSNLKVINESVSAMKEHLQNFQAQLILLTTIVDEETTRLYFQRDRKNDPRLLISKERIHDDEFKGIFCISKDKY